MPMFNHKGENIHNKHDRTHRYSYDPTYQTSHNQATKSSQRDSYEDVFKEFEKLQIKAENIAQRDPAFAARLENLAQRFSESRKQKQGHNQQNNKNRFPFPPPPPSFNPFQPPNYFRGFVPTPPPSNIPPPTQHSHAHHHAQPPPPPHYYANSSSFGNGSTIPPNGKNNTFNFGPQAPPPPPPFYHHHHHRHHHQSHQSHPNHHQQHHQNSQHRNRHKAYYSENPDTLFVVEDDHNPKKTTVKIKNYNLFMEENLQN